MKNIIWFEDSSDNDYAQIGGKNAKLGQMLQLNIPVPPGFAVTTGAFDRFLDITEIRAKIKSLIASISYAYIRDLGEVAYQVQELIRTTPIPDNITSEIREAYGKLAGVCGRPNIPVAVRSSATSEDLETASFAGQHETFLWLCNEDETIRYISECWASLFTSRAIAYRHRVKWPQDKVSISVGVQRMVRAKSAGVMFTVHPVSGDPGQIVIEGNWGLGESVVGGKVDVDIYTVSKKQMKVTDRRMGEKHMQVVADRCGTVIEEELPAARRNTYVLDEEEALEIAKRGQFLESYFGQPQDVEWAIDSEMSFPGNIFLLQTRPVVGVKIQKIMTEEEALIGQLLHSLF